MADYRVRGVSVNVPQKKGGPVGKATLAICTLNRRTDLLNTLKELEKQRCETPWELVVVDNGSDDGSFEAAREFMLRSHLCMRVVRESRRGVSFARNRALAEGEGDILVFVDDDVDCDPRLLASHLTAFEDGFVLATGGRIIPCLPDNTPEWLRDALDQEVGGPTTRYDYGDEVAEIKNKRIYALPSSCNLGLRRRLAIEIGGFRTDLGWTPGGGRIGGEDTNLLMRISRLDGKVLYLPEATVIHRVQPERVTKAYYRIWNLGYGRASVLMRGRPGPVFAFIKILEQLFRILRYSIFPGSLLFDSKAKRIRKRWQALGRILELLRIYWEP